MAQRAAPLRACPSCGSTDRETTRRERVPGGTDWRYYACNDCDYEWRQ
jgi:formate dehydrogenase maturation protein FdhE